MKRNGNMHVRVLVARWKWKHGLSFTLSLCSGPVPIQLSMALLNDDDTLCSRMYCFVFQCSHVKLYNKILGIRSELLFPQCFVTNYMQLRCDIVRIEDCNCKNYQTNEIWTAGITHKKTRDKKEIHKIHMISPILYRTFCCCVIALLIMHSLHKVQLTYLSDADGRSYIDSHFVRSKMFVGFR